MAARVRHRGESRVAAPVAGLIFLVVVMLAVYFAFSQANPFATPFELKATFANADEHPHELAGPDRGRRGRQGQEGRGRRRRLDGRRRSRWRSTTRGLPIHKDAYMKIRPRIFLEGNFFVDLQPGSPVRRDARVGETIGMGQTDGPVQLDQVLTSLQSDVRGNLQSLLKGYGSAIYDDPAPGEDEENDADPDTKGENGGRVAQRLARLLRRGAARHRARQPGAARHRAARPVEADRRRAEDVGQARLARGPAQGPDHQLQPHDRRRSRPRPTTCARRSRCCRGCSSSANPAFDALNALVPADARVRPRDPARRPRDPGHDRGLVPVDRADARARLARRAPGPRRRPAPGRRRPVVAHRRHDRAAAAGRPGQPLLRSTCILPTGDIKIEDGFLTTGKENYKEFWQAMVGLSGEAQNFDGNGSYVRFQTGGGSNTLSTGNDRLRHGPGTGEPLFGNFTLQPIGTRPARPAVKPPVNRKAPCYKQQDPGPQLREGGGGSVKLAIRKHLRDFLAILRPVRDRRSAWPRTSCPTSASTCRRGCPGIGTDFYEVEGRVLDGPGRRAGPGPDRRHRGRARSARSARSSSERRRRREAEDPREVRADLQGRDDAAAPEDRPEGHDRRDGPGHEGRRERQGGRDDPGLRRPRPT